MRKLTLFLLINCLLSACSSFFEKEVEDPNLQISRKLLVQAFICPQDTLLTVEVRYVVPSVGIFPESQTYNDDVEDADVKLSDGTKTVQLRYERFKNFSIPADSLFIAPGGTFSLTVTTPDGKKAEATCIVPESGVEVSSIVIRQVSDDPEEDRNKVVSFEDIAGETNYYSVLSVLTQKSPDFPNFRAINERKIYGLTDNNADGKTVVTPPMTVFVTNNSPGFGGTTETGFLFVNNTDINYYLFHQSLINQTFDTPFAEPVPIFTNIKGGVGIFAGYFRTRITVRN
jgi:hypothetical protein